MFKNTRSAIVVLLFLLIPVSKSFSQIGVGIKFGGNLSHADGLSFHSSNRVGFQAGGIISYHFRPNMAIQVEPTYNISRIRANSETVDYLNGIAKGNKALQFFDFLILFKLNVTSGFALLGGIEFNELLNEDKYHLNNGERAFNSGSQLGYTFGLELGKLYFRYRAVERKTVVYRNWNTLIEQYQIGVKWIVF
ncbi:hypothetical protein KO02_21985 [Sphingobacterium sp. ML3W]|uniref:outer membrane beta-barrel protein n=1 Tax=Sphingobacterium sp. ML3W TaxID=1538644 RepID=UPI0004F620BC|nr:outer membrane beta-barrel protein [Sphingobacterium sp. ML3W]AIM39056.1 hypothetical protein KO02_21985 [Sphingobacterium sp. ML3W]